MTKFCKDCKYAKKPLLDKIFFSGNEFLKCKHEKAIRPNNTESDDYSFLVDGKRNKKKEYYYCSSQRMFGCGKEGKYFEKK